MSAPIDADVRLILSQIAGGQSASLNGRGAAHILDLLARVMPPEPTHQTKYVMQTAFQDAPDDWAYIYRALYAHLAKPPTRTVETWEVRYAVSNGHGEWFTGSWSSVNRSDCETFQQVREPDRERYSCWSIVGPIERQIPDAGSGR